MASLAGLLKQQAPPANPQTPATRTNPEHDWYVALQCVRRTAEEAKEKADQRPPEVLAILEGIRVACSQLLADTTPQVVALRLAAGVTTAVNPQLAAQLTALADQMSAPPIAPGGGGAPMMPPAGGLGAPPLAMPHMPGSPVAATPPGGGATAGGSPPVSPGVVPG